MTKWEYETFAFTAINGGELKAAMNKLGREGWEYCGASAFPVQIPVDTADPPKMVDGMIYCYLFKRPAALVAAYGPNNPQFIHGG